MSNPKVLDLRRPILVTMESFSHLKDAHLVSDDGSIFEATLIECDVVSRNRTLYQLEDVMASMQDRRVQEKIDNKVFMGEGEHPYSESEEALPLKRLMRVEPSRWSHRVDNYWADGNCIRGTVQWAGPLGDMYRRMLVEHGSNLAMSIRAYTPNYIKKRDDNGDYVIKKHLMFIAAYDVVTLPGLSRARIMDPEAYSEISKRDKISISSNKDIVTKTTESLVEVTYKNPINEIRDIMHSEEGANIMCDLFGVNVDSTQMTISGKNTLSVITEEGVRLDLPLSRTILSDIL